MSRVQVLQGVFKFSFYFIKTNVIYKLAYKGGEVAEWLKALDC